jgi:hypothetical protein
VINNTHVHVVKCRISGIYGYLVYLFWEGSTIKHGVHTVHYWLSYTCIKQCETLKSKQGKEFNVL